MIAEAVRRDQVHTLSSDWEGSMKRKITVAALLGLVALTFSSIGFSGTAGAAGGPALLTDPSKLQEGTITQNIVAGANWFITNNTDGLLLPGSYEITGDVVAGEGGTGGGWSVNTANSTCVLDGNALRGVTRSLSPNETCFFQVRFDPSTLPSGDYKAKINASFGSRKTSAPAFVTLVRI